MLHQLLAIVRSRKKWGNPSPARIAVLETGNLNFLLPLFGSEPYTVVPANVEELYLTLSMLRLTIHHVLRTGSLAVGYATAVLEHVRPAIVVTMVDNSQVFQRVAAYYKGCRFLAIQNGNRALSRDNPTGSSICHSEFACLGRYEVDQYRKHGASVQTFYPVGSLRDSYYRNSGQTWKVAGSFDLCVVSQLTPGAYQRHTERMDGMKLLVAHLKRFCEARGVRLCVATKKDPLQQTDLYRWECDWFKEHLGDDVEVIPNLRDSFTTYAVMDSVRVSVGMHTTAMREALGRRKKILSCNFTGNPVYDFPVPGPWTLSDPDYAQFERRLKWLLEMSEDEFCRLCGDAPEYLIGYDSACPTHIFLQKLIAAAVQGASCSSTSASSPAGEMLSDR